MLLVNDASSTDTLWIGPDDPTLCCRESVVALRRHDPLSAR
ncbi:hypothetical protein [Micromonospora sp. KC213]|nr:hypothetical protein [Micromonospora sp. KC213]